MIVALQNDSYTFREGSTDARLCLTVVSGSSDCPVSFPFAVSLSTTDETAGE